MEDLVSYAGLKKTPIEERAEFTKKHFSSTFDFADIEAKEKEEAEQLEIEKINKLNVYYQFDEFIKSKKRKVSKAPLTVRLSISYYRLGL